MCICQGRLFRVPPLVVEILSAEGGDMLCCEPPVSESAQLMRTDAAYTCTAKKKPQNNFYHCVGLRRRIRRMERTCWSSPSRTLK